MNSRFGDGIQRCVKAIAGDVGAHQAPQTLNMSEVRAVSRQVHQFDALTMVGGKGLNGSCRMNRGVVQDDKPEVLWVEVD